MQNAEATGPETKPPAESLELLALAERLRLRAHRMARAQYLAAKRVSRMHSFLGVPVVVLTAAVGTSLFATAGSGSGRAVSITAGLLSALAAAAAALQTFFRYSERAEKHRSSAAAFAGLKRELDLFMVKARASDVADRDVQQLDILIQRFNDLEANSIDVADSFYDQARREQDQDDEGV